MALTVSLRTPERLIVCSPGVDVTYFRELVGKRERERERERENDFYKINTLKDNAHTHTCTHKTHTHTHLRSGEAVTPNTDVDGDRASILLPT